MPIYQNADLFTLQKSNQQKDPPGKIVFLCESFSSKITLRIMNNGALSFSSWLNFPHFSPQWVKEGASGANTPSGPPDYNDFETHGVRREPSGKCTHLLLTVLHNLLAASQLQEDFE